MSNLNPSDVEGIVQAMDLSAQAKANVPPTATAMQKFTMLYAPMARDEAADRSQTQWYLGSCVARAVEEVTRGVDPKLLAQEIKAVVRQFADAVREPVGRVKLYYQVYDAFKAAEVRKDQLTWGYHSLVLQRVKDGTPEDRLHLLQQAVDHKLSQGDLQKHINKVQKAKQDQRERLLVQLKRAEAALARAKAAWNRYLQTHGDGTLVGANGPVAA